MHSSAKNPDSGLHVAHPGRAPLALAVGLGVALVAGAVAGWNFTFLALLVVALGVAVDLRVIAAAGACGAASAWLLGAITRRTGTFLLDRTPLGAWLDSMAADPWVAMLGWDQPQVIGGALIALVVAVPVGRAGWQVARRKASGEGPKPRLLRRRAYLVAPAAVLLFAALSFTLGSDLLVRRMLDVLAERNGASVEAAARRLSLATGELVLDRLEMADPAHLERNRLQVEHVHARLNVAALLHGRLEIDDLRLEGIQRDVARLKPARALPAQYAELSVSRSEPRPRSGQVELENYLHAPSEWINRLGTLAQLLALVDRIERRETAPSAGRAARPPEIVIRHATAEGFAGGFGLGSKPVIELWDVASKGSGPQRQPRLKIVLPEWAVNLEATLAQHEDERRWDVRLQAFTLPLAELIDYQVPGGRLRVEMGTLDIGGQGWMDNNGFEVVLEAVAEDVVAHVVGQGPVAGIEPRQWNEGLELLGRMRGELTADGTWSAPRLSISTHELAKQFQYQLRSAGAHELLSEIDAQLSDASLAPKGLSENRPLRGNQGPLASGASQNEPVSDSSRTASDPYVVADNAPRPAPAEIEPLAAGESAAAVEEPLAASPPPMPLTVDQPTKTSAAVAQRQLEALPPLVPPAQVTLEQPQSIAAQAVATVREERVTSRSAPEPPAKALVARRVVVSDELFGPPPQAVPPSAPPYQTQAGKTMPAWRPPPSGPMPRYTPPPPVENRKKPPRPPLETRGKLPAPSPSRPRAPAPVAKQTLPGTIGFSQGRDELVAPPSTAAVPEPVGTPATTRRPSAPSAEKKPWYQRWW